MCSINFRNNLPPSSQGTQKHMKMKLLCAKEQWLPPPYSLCRRCLQHQRESCFFILNISNASNLKSITPLPSILQSQIEPGFQLVQSFCFRMILCVPIDDPMTGQVTLFCWDTYENKNNLILSREHQFQKAIAWKAAKHLLVNRSGRCIPFQCSYHSWKAELGQAWQMQCQTSPGSANTWADWHQHTQIPAVSTPGPGKNYYIFTDI